MPEKLYRFAEKKKKSGAEINTRSLMKKQFRVKFMNKKYDYKIQSFEELPSTNTYLKEQARLGAPEGTVIVAERQTAGRGRSGRSFYSPKASGLYMSVLFRPEKAVPFHYITPAAAVSVCRALEMSGAKKLGIKWVNDIFSENRKVCGILTEIEFVKNTSKTDFIIVGIGINLTTTDFPDSIRDIAGAVFENQCVDMKKIMTDILDSLFDFYYDIENKKFLSEYKQRSVILNRRVTLISGEQRKEAFVIDIDDDFCLVVKFPDGNISKINSGEVSIRL